MPEVPTIGARSFQFPTAEVSMRARFSVAHAWAAARFARQAYALEVDPGPPPGRDRGDVLWEHRALVTASLFATAAFLEATINELFADAADEEHEHERLAGLGLARPALAEAWRKKIRRCRPPTLAKYDRALELAGHPRFDRAADLWRDVRAVFELRNAIVHYVPEWVNFAKEASDPTNSFTALAGRFSPNALYADSGNPFRPDRCLGYGCSRWALHAALAFADEFARRMGLPVPLADYRDALALP